MLLPILGMKFQIVLAGFLAIGVYSQIPW